VLLTDREGGHVGALDPHDDLAAILANARRVVGSGT
jgi:hypothetical protein